MKRHFMYGALLAGMAACHSPQPEQPLNLVYVFPDQFRKQSLAFWDQPEFVGAIRTKADPVYTPQLDRFAKEGIVLTRMVSN